MPYLCMFCGLAVLCVSGLFLCILLLKLLFLDVFVEFLFIYLWASNCSVMFKIVCVGQT